MFGTHKALLGDEAKDVEINWTHRAYGEIE